MKTRKEYLQDYLKMLDEHIAKKRYKRQFLEYLDMQIIDNMQIEILAEAEDIDQDLFRLGQMSATEGIRKIIRKELEKNERKGSL